MYVEMGEVWGDFGDELQGACGIPHDGNAFSADVMLVVPAGGVEGRAFEGLHSREVGYGGTVELAEAGHHHVDLGCFSIFGSELPDVCGFIERERGDLGIEADVGHKLVFGGEILEVGEDFWLS